jgi:sigma-E factor negative regulatory protein RseC
MKQTATVVRHDGRLMAEVTRAGACGNCRSCELGRRDTVYVELPKGQYEEGQAVELELSDASFSRASLIAYGIPVAAFFVGLFVARAFTDVDYVQAIAAIGALAVALLGIKMYDRHVKASGKYAPKARPCRENGGKYGGDQDT